MCLGYLMWMSRARQGRCGLRREEARCKEKLKRASASAWAEQRKNAQERKE